MKSLVKRVLEGDGLAVREFYESYKAMVSDYLRIKLPEDRVEEVLQDVFLSALDSLNLYRGEAKLKTWLLAIARHEVADFYRKRYARKAVELTVKLFEGLAEEAKTPELVYFRREMKEKIEQTMKKLNKRYREVLFWRFEVGLSVKEVAERMNLGFKATESLLFRARRAFALAYEDEGKRVSEVVRSES